MEQTWHTSSHLPQWHKNKEKLFLSQCTPHINSIIDSACHSYLFKLCSIAIFELVDISKFLNAYRSVYIFNTLWKIQLLIYYRLPAIAIVAHIIFLYLLSYCVSRVPFIRYRARILEQSKGTRNREGIELLYRPAGLHRLAESIPWNRFLGSFKV